jgi:hypothetical protein
MKFKFLPLLFVLITNFSFAQETALIKKGRPILPAAGDLSLSFDAVPFLNYFGNFFSDKNNSPEAMFTKQHPLTFVGSYVKKDNLAYRAKIRVGFGTDKFDTLVQRVGSTNINEIVSNETKRSTTNITIGGGIQKWRGYDRLRAFYGGEILFGIGTDKTTYSYGNALSNENQDTRKLTYKLGNEYAFTLRGFIGVEYFIAPKISLNAEFGWGPALESRGRGELVSEFWTGGEVKQTTTETGKSKSFTLDNDNAGGAINLSFYF